MDAVTELSRAKLNLSLDVLDRRGDGYHDLRMVMVSCEYGDDVRVSLRRDGEIRAESSLAWLPTDRRNLAVRAVEAFFAHIGEKNPGADIYLRKRVPVGAGMAGGSANAAAVLRALNTLTGAGLDADELRALGLTIGSDVPYCIAGGNMLAEGRGELLTPLCAMPACAVVVCKPAFSISTADLFARIDSHAGRNHPDTAGLIDAMERGDLPGVACRMYNVFEDALPRSCAEVHTLRGALLDGGALGAVMTGTGSAVFGLFENAEQAARARERIRPDCKISFVTEICSECYM